MGFIKVSGKTFTAALPDHLMDIPGDPETWTAARLSGENSRRIWETMTAMNWETVSSYLMVQAWLSYVDCTFTLYDEEEDSVTRMFPKKEAADIMSFSAAWDMLPDSVRDWIIKDVVYEVNPQWDNRPGKRLLDKEEKEGAGKKSGKAGSKDT